MYSLALDESGTHQDAPVVVVGGIAVHETDIDRLEKVVESVLSAHLVPLGLAVHEFEAHAYELKTPTTGAGAQWSTVDAAVRLAIYDDVYNEISAFRASVEALPVRVFAAVIDRRNKSQAKAERAAYDFVLQRFSEFLVEVSEGSGQEQRGLVLHDTRIGYELPLQERVTRSRRINGTYTQLLHAPVFTDSRVSRMVQVADFVTYAMWRHYSAADTAKAESLMPLGGVGAKGDIVGIIHQCPEFRHGTCACPPCTSRY